MKQSEDFFLMQNHEKRGMETTAWTLHEQQSKSVFNIPMYVHWMLHRSFIL